MRDFAVSDLNGVHHLRGKPAQPGAEDDADAWRKPGQRKNVIDGFLRLNEDVYHGCSCKPV
jgi:hypothetical protein